MLTVTRVEDGIYTILNIILIYVVLTVIRVEDGIYTILRMVYIRY